MLSMYLYDAEGLLRSLESALLAAENRASFTEAEIDELFRVMHTWKGSSSMMRFTALARTAHRLENVFARLREGVSLEGGDFETAVALLYAALSHFRAALRALSEGADEPPKDDSLDARIEAFTEKLGAAPVPKPEALSSAAQPPKEIDETGAWRVRVFMKPMPLPGVRSLVVRKALAALCSRVECRPDAPERHPELAESLAKDGLLLLLWPNVPTETLREALSAQPYLASWREEAPEPKKREENPEPKKREEAPEKLVSVRQTRLTELTDWIGELMTARNMLDARAERLKDPELDAWLARQRRLLDALRASAQAMNMVEAESLFFRLRLLTREMCQKLGKDVELVCQGGGTELDRGLADQLYDPLMHLMRNCLDHGIEDAAERERLGKRARGRVTLAATGGAQNLRITLSDDGAGIRSEKVLAKARALGWLDKPDEAYTRREVFEMLMRPGFTTKEAATEYSGRGVGMDAVRRALEKLGAALSIESEPGAGTSFLVDVPTHMRMPDALELVAAGTTFALPVSRIARIETAGPEDAVSLSRALGLGEENGSGGAYLRVRAEKGGYVLRADALGQIRPILVKPLPAYLGRLRGFTDVYEGCALRGDGGVCLVLDVNKLATLE